MEPRKQIQFISLDYDGCLANVTRYMAEVNARRQSTDGKRILPPLIADSQLLATTNTPLLQELTLIQQQYGIDKAYVLVGSNRQDVFVDFNNASRGTGLCFPAIKHLATVIHDNHPQTTTTFDPFLLNDIYNNHEDGVSFREAVAFYEEVVTAEQVIENLPNERRKIRYVDDNKVTHLYGQPYPISAERYGFDESKITLLYAQMQHAAEKAGNDSDIYFDFYDDRDDLLIGLHAFFSANRQLIPGNLTLRLHRYDGELQNSYDDVIGSAQGYNPHYRETTKRMFAAAGYDFARFKADEYNTPNVLQAFRDNPKRLEMFYLEEDLNILDHAIHNLKQASDSELVKHLRALHQHSKEYARDDESQIPAVKKVLTETLAMLTVINKPDIDNDTKQAAIINYQVKCHELTNLQKLLKVVGVIVACLLGLVLGGPALAVVAGVAASRYFFKPCQPIQDVDKVCLALRVNG